MRHLPRTVDRPIVSFRYLSFLLGVTREELRWLADHAQGLYAPYDLIEFKRGRRKERPIDNPCDRLKAVQARIKRSLLDTATFPSFVCGGVRKRSTQDNASAHIRQPEVVALDVRKFFESVTNAQVAAVWRDRFGASQDVAWLLTRLTTYHGHLPQGAPTSTALANLVMLPVISGLRLLSTVRGLNLTIYVDDITVSGRDAKAMIPIVAQALGEHGFKLARNKVKVMRQNVRQEVTGHTVNRTLSNGRERLRVARATVLRALDAGATIKDLQRARGVVSHIRVTSPNQGRWLDSRLVAADQ